RPEAAIWADDDASPFRVQFFHPGFGHHRQVEVAIVDPATNTTTLVPWRSDRFRFDPPAPSTLGAASAALSGPAGFRLHHELNTPGVYDELAVFLGASYFRLLGAGQVYGISARALAIDVTAPTGEEFPFFRAFSIEKPAPKNPSSPPQIVVNALLDSVRVTGAYRFVITPGATTEVDVDAVVFARADVAGLGLAPLTSMYLQGDARRDDFRPEVHDSDGLLLQTGSGEQVWRPLLNPKVVREYAFVDEQPRAFGLLQRDRDFEHYQDLETHQERRPSLWVTPRGAWGRGHVQLVELPTENEFMDNIVAAWRPAAPLRKGESLRYGYRLSSSLTEPEALRVVGGEQPLARVVATRSGTAAAMGIKHVDPRARVFTIDFVGDALDPHGTSAATTASTAPMQVQLTTTSGTVSPATLQPNPSTKGWRVAFTFTPAANGDAVTVADLRLTIVRAGRALTETWTLPCP
ncbi:MAG TPA: glucan biosynthesis protein, partial [Myxococcota bacterium]